MRIDGSWQVCDGGILRPVIRGEAVGADGIPKPVSFLVDTGADRTVFCAAALSDLGLPMTPAASPLGGVGGLAATVFVDATVHLPRDGGMAVFRRWFAGFTAGESLDMSVLGRDILNLFAVIVDRPRDVVCLLAQHHGYSIQP